MLSIRADRRGLLEGLLYDGIVAADSGESLTDREYRAGRCSPMSLTTAPGTRLFSVSAADCGIVRFKWLNSVLRIDFHIVELSLSKPTLTLLKLTMSGLAHSPG
jgi:hypothetical protein